MTSNFLKGSIFLLFPLLTLGGDTYYEVRSANGETTLTPATPEQIAQSQQIQQQQLQLAAAAPTNTGSHIGASSGFNNQFGISSGLFPAQSYFSLNNLVAASPWVGGAALGIFLVYFFQYIFSGGASKLLASKFYNEDEVDDGAVDGSKGEKGDLKKDSVVGPHKTADNDIRDGAGKSRRKRHAYRVARTAETIQSQIDDFADKYIY